jgi:invasion protein IalB
MRDKTVSFRPAVHLALIFIRTGLVLLPVAAHAGDSTVDTTGREATTTRLAQLPATSPLPAATTKPPFRQIQAQAQVQPQGQAPAQPAPLVLQRTEILNFDGWVATCREFTDKTKGRVCSAQIEAQQSNNVVFVWTVSANESKQFASVFQVPTGLLIGPGVEVRMGKANPRTVPFTSCEPGRCTATVVMDNNFIRDAQATESAEVVVRAVSGNNVQFNIPMKGFEKALGVLKGALK